MHKQKRSLFYRVVKWLVRLFYPKIAISGRENLPDEAAVIVANHTQMNGPIACELYFPRQLAIWCAGQMMHLKEVPAYAYQDFWSQKPKLLRPFYKFLSYLIAPLSVCIFNSADTIAVYRDSRIISTFKTTVKRLCEDYSVVIFPEHDEPYNNIICQFQDRFIDVARLYYKKTGKALSFVPMYIAPKLKTMYLGKPIRFCADNPIERERERICSYLMTQITQIAYALPEHTVVPYKNISRKDYPTNIAKETSHEEASD